MAVVGAPKHPIQTVLPPWSRFEIDGSGRRYIEMDARGGPVSAVTHQELFPHGETISLMCSAEVQGTLRRGTDSYEGLGVAVQAYVRDSSSNGLRRVWQQRPDLQGDPALWVSGNYSAWTKVNFVVQMPDGVSPDYVRVSWIVRGNGGQVRLTSFEVRDFYSRAYSTVVPPARYDDWVPNRRQYAPGWVAGSDRSELARRGTFAAGTNIFARYLETFTPRVAAGQPIEIQLRGEIHQTFMQDEKFNPVDHFAGLALKCRRSSDQGTDWIKAPLDTGKTGQNLLSGEVSLSTNTVAFAGYNQIEPLIYMFPARGYVVNNVNVVLFEHRGLEAKIVIHDAVESGTT